MQPFEVFVLGVGDAFSARHVGSSLLLRQGDFRLAIDCPDRYAGVLLQTAEKIAEPLTLDTIDAWLLTHVHGDHINGVEGVAFFLHFVLGKRMRLWCSPDLGEVLWDSRLAASMGALWDGQATRRKRFEDYFDYTPLLWGAPTPIGPFRVTTRQTRHHVPTCALLIEGEGGTLGYSCDTAFEPELIDFLSPADVIIHETNFGPAHTPLSALEALPETLRARLRLIHYPDQLDLEASLLKPLCEGDHFVVEKATDAP
jgi:ribonuclease BN (tRNA processing enzyme)